MSGLRKYDLEDRLVKFAIMILEICDLLPNSKAGQNLEHQLSKSGTAPALMYGEAQAAESVAGFLHKMKMVLKELRETRINLRIIDEKPLIVHEKVKITFKECNELIGIFTASITTAKKNKS
ncbi:MAG TPA: four helix bundle protein [Flavisolibacter sp.]|nr:four helix bundle protein [Flavisolibacter sp.]